MCKTVLLEHQRSKMGIKVVNPVAGMMVMRNAYKKHRIQSLTVRPTITFTRTTKEN
jgi:hypothetical protein